MSEQSNKFLQSPAVFSEVLSPSDHAELIQTLRSHLPQLPLHQGFGRYYADESQIPLLQKYAEQLTPLAQKVFNSLTLKPTYTFFAHYDGSLNPCLAAHKDDNACTYTLDLCLYQTITWNLWVENQPYSLMPNEALAYYGNDQLHWREQFPGNTNDHVAMVFFHFAEPDHWYFTKGPKYLDIIRFQNLILQRRKEKESKS